MMPPQTYAFVDDETYFLEFEWNPETQLMGCTVTEVDTGLSVLLHLAGKRLSREPDVQTLAMVGAGAGVSGTAVQVSVPPAPTPSPSLAGGAPGVGAPVGVPAGSAPSALGGAAAISSGS